VLRWVHPMIMLLVALSHYATRHVHCVDRSGGGGSIAACIKQQAPARLMRTVHHLQVTPTI
jgi:hypothetical protein